MEIKRTVLPPFGGPREESGANGSLWSMGGGIIGSPEPVAGFVTADVTLTGVSMSTISGPGTDWAFAKGVHSVTVGDWVRASGFNVIDEDGNITPSGSIDINGDYEIDAVYGSYFTSVALRAEIGALSMQWASSFGEDGTVQVDSQ
jgi:hypothetical protein